MLRKLWWFLASFDPRIAEAHAGYELCDAAEKGLDGIAKELKRIQAEFKQWEERKKMTIS